MSRTVVFKVSYVNVKKGLLPPVSFLFVSLLCESFQLKRIELDIKFAESGCIFLNRTL